MTNIYSKKVSVTNIDGIHARPSSMIVVKAIELKAVGVFIKKVSNPSQKTDPTSIMSLMQMAAHFGTELIVYTENNNMHKAVDGLVELINSGFGEELGPRK